MRVKTAYIEITGYCNFNCAACYNESGATAGQGEMTAARIGKAMDTLSALGAEKFIFSGGEPLLHSEFDGLLSLTEARPGQSFAFVTNGSVRNERLLSLLRERDNYYLQISLDGSCEEVNRLTRGGGSFALAMSMIKAAGQANLRNKPLLKMTVSRHNIADVPDFFAFACEHGFQPEFGFVRRSGAAGGRWDELAVDSRRLYREVTAAIPALNTRYAAEAVQPASTLVCPFTKDGEPLNPAVKVTGDIQPCQSLYDSRFSIGNLFDNGPGFWEEKFKDIQAAARERLSRDYGCGRCLAKAGCGRGCMAQAVELTSDPLGDDGGCPARRLKLAGELAAQVSGGAAGSESSPR